jgi:hypothetical protein
VLSSKIVSTPNLNEKIDMGRCRFRPEAIRVCRKRQKDARNARDLSDSRDARVARIQGRKDAGEKKIK